MSLSKNWEAVGRTRVNRRLFQFLYPTDLEALAGVRRLLSYLPQNWREPAPSSHQVTRSIDSARTSMRSS